MSTDITVSRRSALAVGAGGFMALTVSRAGPRPPGP